MSTELPQPIAEPIDASLAVQHGETASVAFVTDAEAWDRLVAQAPFPHLPQSYAYGEGKRGTGWLVRRALFRINGHPVAFATVLERRVLGLRLVARVNRGPVFLHPAPSADQRRIVYAALRQHWRGLLMIAPSLEFGTQSDAILREAGFFRRQLHGWCSGRIDLSRDEDAVWKGFTSGFRNRVRNAEKAGASLRVSGDESAFEWLIAQHLDNMRDKEFRGPAPELLRGIRNAAPQAVTVFQLVQDDAPVAGMSIVRFGRHAEYHIGWFGPEGRKLNAGNFLMWSIMKELRRQGVVSFDVGGMRPGDGYSRFKATMNPVEFELDGEWVSI